MLYTFVLLSEVDSGPGAETPQGHVAAQGTGPAMLKLHLCSADICLGAGPGLSLQTALQGLSTRIFWRLRRLLLGFLVTWFVTTGAFQWGQILWLGCGGCGMGRGRPFFEAQLLQTKKLLISIQFMIKRCSPPCSGSCCRSEARFAERQIGVTFSLPGQGCLHFWTQGELEIGRNLL